MFSTPVGPAAMQLTAPSVGSSAHQPGKALSLRIITRPSTIRPTPSTDCTWLRQTFGTDGLSRMQARMPPTISSQKREAGE
ncbi:hypothetical protein D9M68_729610 [compost metagenome]